MSDTTVSGSNSTFYEDLEHDIAIWSVRLVNRYCSKFEKLVFSPKPSELMKVLNNAVILLCRSLESVHGARTRRLNSLNFRNVQILIVFNFSFFGTCERFHFSVREHFFKCVSNWFDKRYIPIFIIFFSELRVVNIYPT